MLTDLTVRTAKPREKPYKLWDSGGMFLMVTPRGSRWWRLKYRVDGREKSLSTHPLFQLGRQGSFYVAISNSRIEAVS